MAKHTKYFRLSLLLVPMLSLPACWPGETKEQVEVISDEKMVDDGSPVLLRIDGRPVITLKSVDADFEHFLNENPNYRQIIPFMPDVKKNFFHGMVSQEVVNEYVRRNDLDRMPEYQKEVAKMTEQVTRMLNAKYFADRHPVQVVALEIKKFYDENKDKIPDLMESQGGVKAEAVSFANEEDAKAFLAKAKETKDSLEKVATDAGYAENYHDYKMVNAQSIQIDPALKTKIVNIAHVPAIELYNVNDTWWVVKAESKAAPLYVAFEKVKESIEEYLKKQKQMEVFEKNINVYKKDYNVEINDELLTPVSAEQPSDEQMYEMLGQQDPSMQSSRVQEVEPATRTV